MGRILLKVKGATFLFYVCIQLLVDETNHSWRATYHLQSKDTQTQSCLGPPIAPSTVQVSISELELKVPPQEEGVFPWRTILILGNTQIQVKRALKMSYLHRETDKSFTKPSLIHLSMHSCLQRKPLQLQTTPSNMHNCFRESQNPIYPLNTSPKSLYAIRKKILFSLQKFPKAKGRATRLTQDAPSDTSGNQIQPARQSHLTPLTSSTVILPSRMYLCTSIHLVSASCFQARVVKGRRG